jgi:hypothetical protein
MEMKEGRTDLQKKRALEKRERRQKKIQKDTEAPVPTKQQKRKRMIPEKESDMIKLHVVTIQSNFARLTLHTIKQTHVERSGIMCGREGDWVALRVSKCKKATWFKEYLLKGAAQKLCSDQQSCGCGKAGHIVGMIQPVCETKFQGELPTT